MNLRDLRYILAVAEHGHFGRAAKVCHVSQPTLSGQVRRLEDYLGVAIFERQTRGVVPTEVGRRILDHARQALAQSYSGFWVTRLIRRRCLSASE